MELIPFLIKFAKKDNDLNKLVFSSHDYEYGGNPKLNILGSVLFNQDQAIYSIEAVFDFNLQPFMGQPSVVFERKVSVDVEKLVGLDSTQYIYGLAVALQDKIIEMLINGNDIDLFVSEIDNLANWNKKTFLHQPPDLECEFNITWIGYWVAIKFEESLKSWKRQLTS